MVLIVPGAPMRAPRDSCLFLERLVWSTLATPRFARNASMRRKTRYKKKHGNTERCDAPYSAPRGYSARSTGATDCNTKTPPEMPRRNWDPRSCSRTSTCQMQTPYLPLENKHSTPTRSHVQSPSARLEPNLVTWNVQALGSNTRRSNRNTSLHGNDFDVHFVCFQPLFPASQTAL